MAIRYLLPLLILFLSACSNEDEIAQNAHEEVEFFDDSEESNEEVDETRSTVEYVFTELLSVRIGQYQEPGVMVLNHYDWFEGEGKVEGYYWYTKHQKIIELTGFRDDEGWYYLDESYKGKTSGYMEFTTGELKEDSYWSTSNSDGEEQYFSAEVLDSGHPDDFTVEVEHEKYEFEHTITMFDGEKDVEEEGVNEMQVSFINDQYMAFKIFVIGRNAHMGEVGGVAVINGDYAFYENQGEEEWDYCKLQFRFGEDEITVHEEDCSGYHGMNVYFDCTFERVK